MNLPFFRIIGEENDDNMTVSFKNKTPKISKCGTNMIFCIRESMKVRKFLEINTRH